MARRPWPMTHAGKTERGVLDLDALTIARARNLLRNASWVRSNSSRRHSDGSTRLNRWCTPMFESSRSPRWSPHVRPTREVSEIFAGNPDRDQRRVGHSRCADRCRLAPAGRLRDEPRCDGGTAASGGRRRDRRQAGHPRVRVRAERPTDPQSLGTATLPGGSSAGGGVSVAVGSALGAVERTPEGRCASRLPSATVGLKLRTGASAGLEHRAASAPWLDHVGTFTRTVEDAALLLQEIAGFDPASRRSIDDNTSCASIWPWDCGDATGGGARTISRGPRCSPRSPAWSSGPSASSAPFGAILVRVEVRSFSLALPAGFTIFMVEEPRPIGGGSSSAPRTSTRGPGVCSS